MNERGGMCHIYKVNLSTTVLSTAVITMVLVLFCLLEIKEVDGDFIRERVFVTLIGGRGWFRRYSSWFQSCGRAHSAVVTKITEKDRLSKV